MSRLSSTELIKLARRQRGHTGHNSALFCYEGDTLNRKQRRLMAALLKKGETPFSVNLSEGAK